MIIDDFKVPIIKKGISSVSSLKNEFINKKIILFGVQEHLHQLVLRNIFQVT